MRVVKGVLLDKRSSLPTSYFQRRPASNKKERAGLGSARSPRTYGPGSCAGSPHARRASAHHPVRTRGLERPRAPVAPSALTSRASPAARRSLDAVLFFEVRHLTDAVESCQRLFDKNIEMTRNSDLRTKTPMDWIGGRRVRRRGLCPRYTVALIRPARSGSNASSER